MSDSAKIVIVGGGIIGTSIAYHLGKRGAGKDVALLEQNRVGSGTTSAAGGGIRRQFSTEINIRFSIASLDFWRTFEDEIGATCDFRDQDYLFLAVTQAERKTFERSVALQNSLGVPTRLLSPEEAGRIMPGLNVEDLSVASYCEHDGHAGPNEAAQGFARRARDLGVDIREGVTVTGIDTHGGRVRGVETSSGRIDAEIVVNASGAWGGAVGRLAGLDVPVAPYRRTVFVSEPFDALPKHFPVVVDMHFGWAFLREGAGIYMTGTKDKHSSFNLEIDWNGLAEVGETATHRMPILAQARFGKKALAGLYDVSPDNHAIMGPTPELEGFHLACGFSGHGFQHSPAAGRFMAQLLLDGTSELDLSPLHLERFRTGSTLFEPLQAHVGTLSR